MPQQLEPLDGKPLANRGVRLELKYPARPSGARRNERRVVYLRFATPPVTAAEVEIMHLHLSNLANDHGEKAAKSRDN